MNHNLWSVFYCDTEINQVYGTQKLTQKTDGHQRTDFLHGQILFFIPKMKKKIFPLLLKLSQISFIIIFHLNCGYYSLDKTEARINVWYYRTPFVAWPKLIHLKGFDDLIRDASWGQDYRGRYYRVRYPYLKLD